MTHAHPQSHAPAQPAVSVVVPCYNQATFLPARLASIFGQTHAPAEVIIVDDASTDNTASRLAAVSSRIPLRVHRNTVRNGRPCAQWQNGIELARHDWIWIAEADDASEPTFLATLLAAAARNPKAGFIYCQSALTGADGKAHGTFLDFTDELATHHWRNDHAVSGAAEAREFLSLRNTIPNVGACLVRRETWMATLPLDTSLRLCGDWLAYARLLARTDVAFVAAPLNRFRTHSGTVRASTTVSAQIAEGYAVRRTIAALHGLDDGERELAARFAATELLRLQSEAASLDRAALPADALTAAEAFDRNISDRLRNPRRSVMPRAELYYAANGNFSEANRSSRVFAPGAWRKVELVAGPGALRLDPLNQHGRVEIRRLTIREADTGRTAWSADRAESFDAIRVAGDAHRERGAAPFTIISAGDDPQILLPEISSSLPRLIEMEARITLSGDERTAR